MQSDVSGAVPPQDVGQEWQQGLRSPAFIPNLQGSCHWRVCLFFLSVNKKPARSSSIILSFPAARLQTSSVSGQEEGDSAIPGGMWRWLHTRGEAEKLIPAASQLIVSPVQGSTNIEGLEQWKRLWSHYSSRDQGLTEVVPKRIVK